MQHETKNESGATGGLKRSFGQLSAVLKKEDVIGIGGWLIFFQFFAIFGMFIVVDILRFWVPASYLHLCDIIGLLILASLLVCMALFYARKKLFRILAIVVAALFVAYMVSDKLPVYYGVLTYSERWEIGVIAALLVLIVFSLYRSRRVKNTFDPLKSTKNKAAEKALYPPHKQFAGKWMALVIFVIISSLSLGLDTYKIMGIGSVTYYYYLVFFWVLPFVGAVLLAVRKMKALRVFCIIELCAISGLILGETIVLMSAMLSGELWLWGLRWPIVDIVILSADIVIIFALLFSRRVKNMFVPRLPVSGEKAQAEDGGGRPAGRCFGE